MARKREPEREKLALRLGASIARHRGAQRLTQAQLADLVDKSTEWIGKIERGEQWPSDELLDDLLGALQVPQQEQRELHLVLAALGQSRKDMRDLLLAKLNLAVLSPREHELLVDDDAAEIRARGQQMVNRISETIHREPRVKARLLEAWTAQTELLCRTLATEAAPEPARKRRRKR